VSELADAETMVSHVVGTCSVILPHPPTYFHGRREA
jgi:hypothetical protein